jgi:hypothetical protein
MVLWSSKPWKVFKSEYFTAIIFNAIALNIHKQIYYLSAVT